MAIEIGLHLLGDRLGLVVGAPDQRLLYSRFDVGHREVR